MASPAISVIHDGYNLLAVVDASETYPKLRLKISLVGAMYAGVVRTDTFAVASKLQKTYNRNEIQEWEAVWSATDGRSLSSLRSG